MVQALGLVERILEVVLGFPDRLLFTSEEAAATLQGRTLTNLYAARPAWLADAHAALEAAVVDAHGGGDDRRAGRLGDDEAPAWLFRLNQKRAGLAAMPRTSDDVKVSKVPGTSETADGQPVRAGIG